MKTLHLKTVKVKLKKKCFVFIIYLNLCTKLYVLEFKAKLINVYTSEWVKDKELHRGTFL